MPQQMSTPGYLYEFTPFPSIERGLPLAPRLVGGNEDPGSSPVVANSGGSNTKYILPTFGYTVTQELRNTWARRALDQKTKLTNDPSV